ncbi:MAG: MucR family transcriptional regulator [Sphingomonadales bacterium]|nr:MucR family transcriptional regulator [Sphingomonadales bacterium]MDE2569615.1 MucR family transcriptional regulator [Sphingomonadales bacterium]
MADETLLTLAADIVSAHVSNNALSADQLPVLIQSVYTSLAGLGQEPEPVEEKRQPAVSIRASVKPDAIACLECGAKMKMLKRHLATDHGLTPDEYRTRWKLAADYPMVAPDYAARRKELAVKIGLGRKPGQKVAKAAAKPKAPGRKKLGVAFDSVAEPVA